MHHMKATIYCRVSTTEQTELGTSLENQRSRAIAWCTANGYEVESIHVESMSGGKASNRPELQKALSMVCKLKGILVVYSLSRLARSVKDTLLIAERLEKFSANLASITEKIDTNSAMGKMVFRLLSTLNEFEKDQLVERTTSAMAHLRRCNKRISTRIPLGFDLGTDGETLTVNPAEQEIVFRIVTMRQQGVTFGSIAKTMRDANVSTKNGGHWFPSTIRAILDRQHKLAA